MAGFAAFLAARMHADAVAVAVLIAAAWLDVFDGWYARNRAQCSTLGKHLDPFADKVLVGVVYAWIGIDADSALVWALIAVAAAREIAVTVLRAYSRRCFGRFIPASTLGRAKMAAQCVAGLTILGVTHFLGRTVPTKVVAPAIIATLAVSYAAAAAYAREWRRHLVAAPAGGVQSKGACRRPEADPLCATHDHG